MAGFGSNPTTSTQSALSNNQFPVSSVAVPGEASGNLTALKGGVETTDSNGNKLAGAAMYTYDGENETLGAKGNSAITDSTQSGTLMSFIKGLVKIWADIWDSVNHRIRVDGSGVTQPTLDTNSANILAALGAITDGKYTTGSGDVISILKGIFSELSPGQFPSNESVSVVLASDQSTVPVSQHATSPVSGTLQNAATAIGVGTAFNVTGMGTVMFTVSGLGSGSITFEGSEDGSTFGNLYTTQQGTGIIGYSTASNGIYEAQVAGLQSVHAHITSYTSGPITVTAHAVPVASAPRTVNINIPNGLPASSAQIGHVVIDSGTLAAILYAWNGGAPGSQTLDRLRQMLAFTPQTSSISSGGGVGSTSIVLANVTGLQAGQWIKLTGGTSEWVLTSASYSPGSTTVAITTAITNASHTTASWNAYSPDGPGSSLFYPESAGATGLILGHGNQGVMAQADSLGNLMVNLAAGSVSATNPSVNSDGTAIASSSTLVGGSNGGTQQPFQLDGSNNLKITGTVTANVGTGTQAIEQTDLTTGPTVISAAQPSIGTPVSNATVQLALGQGQSSWKATVYADAGFTSATTIVADTQIDGVNWIATSFKVAGSTTAGTVQSVTGPGPIEISGNAGSKAIIRIRCSVLNSGESVYVYMRSGAGISDVGIIGETAVNLNQVNGATLSSSNAVPTLDTNSANILAALGNIADGKYTTGSGDIISILKGIFGELSPGQFPSNESVSVVVASDQSTIPVSQHAANVRFRYTAKCSYRDGGRDNTCVAWQRLCDIHNLRNVCWHSHLSRDGGWDELWQSFLYPTWHYTRWGNGDITWVI